VGVTPSKKQVAKRREQKYYLPMTPTEKKYAKNVGKLFLVKEKRYNMDRKEFEIEHGLCMVYGMVRTGYTGKSGAYAYQINTLTPVEQEWRRDFAVRCTGFIEGTRRTYWAGACIYEPLTKENMELIGKVIDDKEKL
jgi:hypothetical protein